MARGEGARLLASLAEQEICSAVAAQTGTSRQALRAGRVMLALCFVACQGSKLFELQRRCTGVSEESETCRSQDSKPNVGWSLILARPAPMIPSPWNGCIPTKTRVRGKRETPRLPRVELGGKAGSTLRILRPAQQPVMADLGRQCSTGELWAMPGCTWKSRDRACRVT